MSSTEGNQESEAKGPRLDKAQVQPRNWLTPVVLVTLKQWNSYGYELMKQATALGFEATNPGTFYRTLRQMERNGMVKSSWETTKGGPARRIYSITDVGEAYLDLWVKGLEQYQQTMNTFFQLYTGKPLRNNEKKDDKRSTGNT